VFSQVWAMGLAIYAKFIKIVSVQVVRKNRNATQSNHRETSNSSVPKLRRSKETKRRQIWK